MRPDDRRANLGWAADAGGDAVEMPLDASLAALDAELSGAGLMARRGLHGRTQPSRAFTGGLRGRLLASIPAAAVPAADAALPRGSSRGSRVRGEPEAGEAWAPTPLAPRVARRTPTVLPRARWSLLAAAALTSVIVAGALGARVDWLLPTPTTEPSKAPSSVIPATPAPSATNAAPILPVATAAPTAATTPQPTKTAAPTPTRKPAPTPAPTPKPTAKPEPTKPPIGPMDLMAKACPGGVVLDWTKPSIDVAHDHVLRSLTGDVPATYPADGTTEVETATTWSATQTDGFDAGVGGGKTATYRAFAFDADDNVLAFSPSRSVTTVAALDLGALGVVENGPGSITFSWAASTVHDACFTYGKLVASPDDPDPSYVKGTPYLAAIGDKTATEVTVEGLPSASTVWLRYELIRVTNTGKFVVGRTDVVQVTYP